LLRGLLVARVRLGKLKVTCSAGVATYPDHARDRQMFFELADRANYAAKPAGRNRVLSIATFRPSNGNPLRPEPAYRL
jgi:GGDEF domain-containing protein